MMTPIDAIEECIRNVTAELVGYYNSDCEELQRKGAEQLKSLVAYAEQGWNLALNLAVEADNYLAGGDPDARDKLREVVKAFDDATAGQAP